MKNLLGLFGTKKKPQNGDVMMMGNEFRRALQTTQRIDKHGVKKGPFTIDEFKEIIGRININTQDTEGLSLVDDCLTYHRLDILKLLIEQRVNLDTQNQLGFSPLLRAVLLHNPPHMDNSLFIKELLNAGANPNLQNNNMNTALHQAITRNQLKNTNLLIEAGANPNLQNNNGNTALHEAIARNQFELAKKMVLKGAKIDIPNNNGGETPFSMALARNNDLAVFLVAFGRYGGDSDLGKQIDALKAQNALVIRVGNNRNIPQPVSWLPNELERELGKTLGSSIPIPENLRLAHASARELRQRDLQHPNSEPLIGRGNEMQ